MKRAAARTLLGLVALLMLSACATSAQHSAGFSQNTLSAQNTNSDSCSQMGYAPGSAQYSQCQDELRIREEVTARKVLNGNKNQPDGVLAQTYGKPAGVLINCTSYQGHTPGAASLCD